MLTTTAMINCVLHGVNVFETGACHTSDYEEILAPARTSGLADLPVPLGRLVCSLRMASNEARLRQA